MFFDRLDERNAMVKSVSHFDNFTKWTFLVVNNMFGFSGRVAYLVKLKEFVKAFGKTVL